MNTASHRRICQTCGGEEYLLLLSYVCDRCNPSKTEEAPTGDYDYYIITRGREAFTYWIINQSGRIAGRVAETLEEAERLALEELAIFGSTVTIRGVRESDISVLPLGTMTKKNALEYPVVVEISR